MKVVDKMAGVAILNASGCANLSQLRVGQKIEKSLFSSSSSSAGRVTSSANNWDNVREQLKGVSLIAFYSMADEFPAKAGAESGTYIAESAFGFGAQYDYSLGDSVVQGLPISIVGGLTYELSREISKLKINNQTQNLATKPSLAFWDFYGNVQLNVMERLAAFGGLNYAIPLEKNFGDDKAKSGIGYQIGATVKLTSQLGIDGIYRWINFKTSNIDEIDLDGFMVRGQYIF